MAKSILIKKNESIVWTEEEIEILISQHENQLFLYSDAFDHQMHQLNQKKNEENEHD
jgi:hypothetical protein